MIARNVLLARLVDCRIGSLETPAEGMEIRPIVDCRIGSLEKIKKQLAPFVES